MLRLWHVFPDCRLLLANALDNPFLLAKWAVVLLLGPHGHATIVEAGKIWLISGQERKLVDFRKFFQNLFKFYSIIKNNSPVIALSPCNGAILTFWVGLATEAGFWKRQKKLLNVKEYHLKLKKFLKTKEVIKGQGIFKSQGSYLKSTKPSIFKY